MVRRFVVCGLLLTAAYHSKADIPGVLREVHSAQPRLAVSYGQPLGPHPLLLRALEGRLAEIPGGGRFPAPGGGSPSSGHRLLQGQFPIVGCVGRREMLFGILPPMMRAPGRWRLLGKSGGAEQGNQQQSMEQAHGEVLQD